MAIPFEELRQRINAKVDACVEIAYLFWDS
jgi:hypothetical protein